MCTVRATYIAYRTVLVLLSGDGILRQQITTPPSSRHSFGHFDVGKLRALLPIFEILGFYLQSRMCSSSLPSWFARDVLVGKIARSVNHLDPDKGVFLKSVIPVLLPDLLILYLHTCLRSGSAEEMPSENMDNHVWCSVGRANMRIALIYQT